MTLFTILNILSIGTMMLIAMWLAGKLAEMKYGILTCLFQLVVHGNTRCLKWLLSNSYYIWYIILQAALILTALTQIGQFMNDSIFTKPLLVFMVSPVLWVSVYFVLRSYEQRVKIKDYEH